MIAFATSRHDKKGNTTKAQTSNSKLDLGLWNRIWAVTLLYGGLSTLAIVELDHATGVFPFLSLFDDQGMVVVILAFGTLEVRHMLSRLYPTSMGEQTFGVAVCRNA